MFTPVLCWCCNYILHRGLHIVYFFSVALVIIICQDPKTLKWWNKHGIGNIKLLGKINADKNKGSGWTALARGCVDPYVLYRFGGMLYKTTVIGPLYYNSKTLYFAYKGRFWSK